MSPVYPQKYKPSCSDTLAFSQLEMDGGIYHSFCPLTIACEQFTLWWEST